MFCFVLFLIPAVALWMVNIVSKNSSQEKAVGGVSEELDPDAWEGGHQRAEGKSSVKLDEEAERAACNMDKTERFVVALTHIYCYPASNVKALSLWISLKEPVSRKCLR